MSKYVITFEDGKAPWSRPLCKLGLHKWVEIAEILAIDHCYMFDVDAHYLGFAFDVCSYRCGVRRYRKRWEK